MAEEHAFAREDIFPSWFANAIQDFLSSARTDLPLSLKNTTTVQVVPDLELGIAGIAIEGAWRFNTGTVSRVHPGGAKGTYIIWAVALKDVINSTPDPFTDHTVRTFDLRITSGANPSGEGVEIFEKVGEIDWSGAAIEAIRQTHGKISGPQIADGALSNSGAFTWTREPGGGLVASLDDGGVTDAKLASSPLGRHEVLWQGGGRLVGKAEAGQYVLAAFINGGAQWLKSTALGDEDSVAAYRLSVADIFIPNKTAKFMVRFSYFAPNGVAPGQELRCKLSEYGGSGPHWNLGDYHETTDVPIPSAAGLQRSALSGQIAVVNYGLEGGKGVTNDLIIPSVHLPGELANANLTIWAELLLTYV